jgi:8-oxo-dGTP pyrophosphatase MutT (NUDIX family)
LLIVKNDAVEIKSNNQQSTISNHQPTVNNHQPMIPERELPWIESLRARLEGPLPGRPAQFKMASLRRLEELGESPVPAPDHRVACVLVLLHWQNGRWHTVLIERTANPRDRHSGQISFPGGRHEPGDPSLADAALREAHEEVGVPPAQVRLLGALTDLYIPVSNFVVHPFVGLLTRPAALRPQPGEVEAILTPPLLAFDRAESRRVTDITLGSGLILQRVPYFDVDGRIVWGATAMILSEFMELLQVR